MTKSEEEVLVLSDLLPKNLTKEEAKQIKEQTKQLFQQYQQGDTEVRNQIVMLNLGLVYAKVANWMKTRTLTGQELFTREDLLQECFVKLIECVDSYRNERAEFSTYVYSCLTTELRCQFDQYSTNTFSSRYLYQTNRKVRQCINRYQEKCGKLPSLDVIAEELNLTKQAVLAVYEGGQVSLSFQQPVYQSCDQGQSDTLGDVVASNEYERMIQKEELRDLRYLLQKGIQTYLTEQEQQQVLFILSHWDGVHAFPFAKLEQEYGYKRNCLGHPFRKAMKKLRKSSKFYEEVKDYLPEKTKG